MTTQADTPWAHRAIAQIEAEYSRTSDTHLIYIPLGKTGIDLYLKDESSHPTGSLKHRLARSLFLYALCNNWIAEGSTVIESSSGSTAVSEAYFARLIGLRFIAVVPRSVAAAKVALIKHQGGQVHYVDRAEDAHDEAIRLAHETGGHYMDQFTYAERATDWRGNNNIAVSIFSQLTNEPHPIPKWVVCGAGTGGTSATIGRYLRYRRLASFLCVADPVSSVFHQHYHDRSLTTAAASSASCIEGIGRSKVEPSFIPDVIDRMIAVHDAHSIGAARALSDFLGRRCGGSTGTNLWVCHLLAGSMIEAGETGSIVTLLCDSGERYADTLFSDDWLAGRKIDWLPGYNRIRTLLDTGVV